MSSLGSSQAVEEAQEPTASSVYLRAMCEAADALAPSGQRPFVQCCGLDVRALTDPNARISLACADAALARAIEFTQDQAFALHWAERSPMLQYDLAASLLATSPSLRAGVESIMLLQRLFSRRIECHFVERGSRAVLSFQPVAATELGRRCRAELGVCGFIRFLRYVGRDDALRTVNFAYERPEHGNEYERIFGPHVRFNQQTTSVEFLRAALDARLTPRNVQLHRTLHQQVEGEFRRQWAKQTTCERVEDLVYASLPTVPRALVAARALGVSERSLRRRLREEQADYHTVVSRARRRRANELWASGSTVAKDLASALGFGSVGSYRRTLRAWREGGDG